MEKGVKEKEKCDRKKKNEIDSSFKITVLYVDNSFFGMKKLKIYLFQLNRQLITEIICK